jgi:hypothetical protein
MVAIIQIRLAILGALFISTGMCYSAYATTINFDDQGITASGGVFQGQPAVTQTINTPDGNVTFSGGTFLTNATFLPVDVTTVYGTVSTGHIYSNPLTITFQNPVTNFFLDVFNGNIVNVDYTVADNEGHSATFNLAPNTQGGMTTIGFAAAGTVITIEATPDQNLFFDFLIDNVNFNEPLPVGLGGPGDTTPLPAALPLFASGLGAMGLFGRRRKRKNAAATAAA